MSQQVTSSPSLAYRTRDHRLRQRAASFLNFKFSMQLVSDALGALTTPSIGEDQLRSSLPKLQQVMESSLASSEPMAHFVLLEATTIRHDVRKMACLNIKDSDISDKLINGPIFSDGMFHPNSLESMLEVVQRPAPRVIKTTFQNAVPKHRQFDIHPRPAFAVPSRRGRDIPARGRGFGRSFRGSDFRGQAPKSTGRGWTGPHRGTRPGAFQTSAPRLASQARPTVQRSSRTRGQTSSRPPFNYMSGSTSNRGRGRRQ